MILEEDQDYISENEESESKIALAEKISRVSGLMDLDWDEEFSQLGGYLEGEAEACTPSTSHGNNGDNGQSQGEVITKNPALEISIDLDDENFGHYDFDNFLFEEKAIVSDTKMKFYLRDEKPSDEGIKHENSLGFQPEKQIKNNKEFEFLENNELMGKIEFGNPKNSEKVEANPQNSFKNNLKNQLKNELKSEFKSRQIDEFKGEGIGSILSKMPEMPNMPFESKDRIQEKREVHRGFSLNEAVESEKSLCIKNSINEKALGISDAILCIHNKEVDELKNSKWEYKKDWSNKREISSEKKDLDKGKRFSMDDMDKPCKSDSRYEFDSGLDSFDRKKKSRNFWSI